MNSYQQEFRANTFGSVFTMIGKTIKEIMLGGGLYLLFILIALLPLIGVLASIDWSPFLQMKNMTDPEEITALAMQVIQEITSTFGIFQAFLLGVSIILCLLCGAWFTTFNMLAVEMKMKGHSWTFSELLQKSFNASVLWVLLFQIFLIMIYVLTVGLGASISMVSSLAFVMLIMAFVFFVMKLILAQAAIVHGNMAVGEAFSYSLKKVAPMNALKYMAMSTLGLIALMVAVMIIGLFSALLAMIPVIGGFLYLVINFALNFVMMAFINITQSVLYFKYGEDLEGDEGMAIEDHLMM